MKGLGRFGEQIPFYSEVPVDLCRNYSLARTSEHTQEPSRTVRSWLLLQPEEVHKAVSKSGCQITSTASSRILSRVTTVSTRSL